MGVTFVQFQKIFIFPIGFNDFINSSGHFRTDLGSFGGHFGVIFGIWGTLKPYLSQFDVEKLEMASVMGICAGLVEPKSGNVEKVWVFKAFLNGQRCDEDPGAGFQVGEPRSQARRRMRRESSCCTLE